jgi:hypothetical protein
MAVFRTSEKYSTAQVAPVDSCGTPVHPGLRTEYLYQELGLLTRLHGDAVLQVPLTAFELGW